MPRPANRRREAVVTALGLLGLGIGLPTTATASPLAPSHEASPGENDAEIVLPGPSTVDWRPVLGPGSESAEPGADAADADPAGEAAGEPGASRLVPEPDPTRANPFHYARVVIKRAPRLTRPPSSADEAAALARAMKERRSMPGLVERWMAGDYFVAIEPEGTSVGEWTFHRTSGGHYVRARDLKPLPLPPMHGERLGEEYRLPLAFVLEDTPAVCERDGELRPCGVAEKHARFNVTGAVDVDGIDHVRAPDGVAVPAASVRTVERVERPEGVPEGARWVHIDLARQALVAYEGEQPVYATLVSSGREGYETPAGLFRIERKYLTKTMRGKDIETDLYYEVGEVPWTMYYDGSFAVHGAYWHNLFGKTKSHGCTNVPPVDARWLYYWSRPEVPDGRRELLDQEGTWFYFSGQSPADGE